MEQLYKIFHIPTGLYATGHSVNTPSIRKKGVQDPHVSMSKKGRAWKRYCDVLVAWQTITKGLNEKQRPELLNDYRMVTFELVQVEIMADADLQTDIQIKNDRYNKRRLEEEKSRLEYRLSQAKNDVQRYKETLPSLEKEISKIQNKLKAYGNDK